MDLIAGQSSLVSFDIVTKRLHQAWELFENITGSTTHYLAGGAPRDLILGKQPNNWDVWLPDMSDNSAIMLQHQLSAHYDFRATKGVDAESQDLPDTLTGGVECDIFFDGVPFTMRSLGYFKIGDYNFNVIVMSGALDLDMLLRSFDWDFCQVGYQPSYGIMGYNSVAEAVKTRIIRFTRISFQSTDAVRLCLGRGRKFEQRFSLLMHPEDIRELEAQLPEKIELETELIRGYRLYDLQGDRQGPVLTGIAGTQWQGPSMEATHGKGNINNPSTAEGKNLCVQHLLAYNDKCMCGINVFKDLPEPKYFFSHQYLAETVVHGVVAEYEHGYRAQFGRINQLWALYDSLRGYQNAVLNLPLDHIALAKRYGVPIMPMTRVMALEMLVDAGAKFTQFWDGRWGRELRDQVDLLDSSSKLMKAYTNDMIKVRGENG